MLSCSLFVFVRLCSPLFAVLTTSMTAQICQKRNNITKRDSKRESNVSRPVKVTPATVSVKTGNRQCSYRHLELVDLKHIRAVSYLTETDGKFDPCA